MYRPNELYDPILSHRSRDGVSAAVAIERVFRELDGHEIEVWRDAGRWLLARVEQAYHKRHTGDVVGDHRSGVAHETSVLGQSGGPPINGDGDRGRQGARVTHNGSATAAPNPAWHDKIPWLDVEVSIFGTSGRKRLGDATERDFSAGLQIRERTAQTMAGQASIMRRVRDEMRSHGDENFQAFADRVGHKIARRLISKVEPKLLPKAAWPLTTAERGT